ncbi:hypothetical protein [Massilia sp. SYSU DXS3249]
MGENKGKGTKGRNYDELSGVGTSSAGVTGTTGNLNDGVRDGGIGKPSAGDTGNRAGSRQSAEPDDDYTTPALGTGTRSKPSGNVQGGSQQGSQQSGSQQSGSQQGGKQQGGSSLGKSLDQDVMGKEN